MSQYTENPNHLDPKEQGPQVVNPFQKFPMGSLGLTVATDLSPTVEHVRMTDHPSMEPGETIHVPIPEPEQVDLKLVKSPDDDTPLPSVIRRSLLKDATPEPDE